ncbi:MULTISPECIES: hypothetical protein [unclassified Paraburkholderia]|uniref:hypothetical protein n=1 Tax=unclassified Paraburkholderia TaxID=2615204 RepID=UPI002AAF8A93|nr:MULTISPECIES: hypothetical protein [unclassified Paraburkholderia]
MNRNQESFVPSDVLLPVVRLHENLNVVTLDPLGHGRTMGYWYLVRQGPVYAHTAFNKRENLLTWLRELGLTLDSELPPHGVRGYVFVSGAYRNALHLSYDTFDRQRAGGTAGRALSNGDYTMSINTLDEDGIHTIHTLNPNMKLRPVYDHRESREMVG